MEFRFERFAIREYTANMRGVDARACWPFGSSEEMKDEEDADEERHRALRSLPPMGSCRRFRWWSADLQASRSGNSSSDAEGEDASAAGIHAAGPCTEDGIDAEDGDGQGKQTSRAVGIKQHQQQQLTKVRTLKKRSIIELFAVAPPIENPQIAAHDAGVDDDDGADSDDEDGGQLRYPPGEEEAAATGVDKGIATNQGENRSGLDDDSDAPTAAAAPPAVPPRKRKLEFVEILMRKKGNKRRRRVTTAATSAATPAQSAAINGNNNNNNLGRRRKRRMHKNNNKKSKVGALHKEEKKDTMHNVGMLSKVDFSLLLRGSVLRRCAKKINKHVGKRKKDITKCLPKKKKKKSSQTASISIKKQFRKGASFPVPGILKTTTRIASSEKNRKNDNTENFTSGCNVSRQSRKRVHFSESNGLVSVRNEHEHADLSPRFPQAVSIRKASSDTPSSFLDESSKDSDVEQVDRLMVASISDVSSPSRENLADVHVSSVVSSPIDLNLQSSETTKFAQSLDLNFTLHDCSSLDMTAPVFLAAAPKDLQSGKLSENPKEKPNENLFWRTISTRDGNGGQLSQFPDRCTMSTCPYTGSNSLSSASSAVRQVNCYPSCVTDHSVNDVFNQVCESQSFSAQNRKDKNHLTENLSRTDPASSCQGKYNTTDVVGLPLNSQGEFITWNSCCNVISNQLSQNHNEGSCSNGGFRTWDAIGPRYDSECLKMKDKFLGHAGFSTNTPQLPRQPVLGRNQYNVTTGHSFGEFPVEFLKDHCQGLMQGHNGYVQSLDTNHLASNIYSRRMAELHPPNACNRMRLIQTGGRSQAGSEIQSTMRLMGKDVTIGSGDCQGLDSSKAWRENHSLNAQPITSLSNQSTSQWCSQERSFNYQPFEASRNLYLSGIHNKNSNLYQLVAGGPRTDLPDIDHEPCEICRNAVSLGSGFERSNLDFGMPNSNQLVVNDSSKWTGNPFTKIPQKPFAEGRLCKSFQSIPLNLDNHQLGQILPFGSPCSSSLRNQYNERHFQPMVAQAHTQNLPHWLRNETRNKNIHSSCFDFIPNHHSCTVSDSNPAPTTTTVCHSILSFPVIDCDSNDAVIHSLPIPCSQGTPFMTPSGVMKSNSMMCNNELKGKQKSSGTLTPGHHFLVSTVHNHKIRKDLDQLSDVFQRPAKKPSFTGEHYSGIREGVVSLHHLCPREVFHGITEKTADEDMVDLNGFEAVNLRSIRESKAGPVRLSAGAKHILRPCQNNEQDRFRPVHSTIPFAVGTSSRNILDPHAKSAKIYQF